MTLYMDTPLSYFARAIFATYALLFFAIAVLDINATATGESACLDSFKNTGLHDVIVTNNITVTCNSGTYASVCVFDLILSAHFFLIYTAWVLCKDRYDSVARAPSEDQKTLTKPVKKTYTKV